MNVSLILRTGVLIFMTLTLINVIVVYNLMKDVEDIKEDKKMIQCPVCQSNNVEKKFNSLLGYDKFECNWCGTLWEKTKNSREVKE